MKKTPYPQTLLDDSEPKLKLSKLIAVVMLLITITTCNAQQLRLKRKVNELSDIHLKKMQELIIDIDSDSDVKLVTTENEPENLTISKNKLKYVPNPNDRSIINVIVKTQEEEKFVFNIVNEFESSDTLTFTPYKVGSALDPTNFYKVKIDTLDANNRKLTIIGKDLIFENVKTNKFRSLFYNGEQSAYPFHTVEIYAENILIKTQVRLPSANLKIRAKKMTFDGSKERPAFDITPLPNKKIVSSKIQQEGEKGLDCGLIDIKIQKINVENWDTVKAVIVARGGKGANAPFGANGVDYPNIELISNPQNIPVIVNRYSCPDRIGFLKEHATNVGTEPRSKSIMILHFNTFVSTSYEAGNARHDYTAYCKYQVYNNINLYNKIFSEENVQKAKPIEGGIPGKGGSGGIVRCNIDISRYVSLVPGEFGDQDTIRQSGRVSGPTEVWSYSEDHIEPTANKGYELLALPQRFSVKGRPNRYTNLPWGKLEIEKSKQEHWLDLSYIEQCISYASEQFRYGYTKEASITFEYFLKNYFNNPDKFRTQENSVEFDLNNSICAQNYNKILLNLDYYGNRYNWVPKLDLAINSSLYRQTIENAFETVSRTIQLGNILAINDKKIDGFEDLLSKIAVANENFYSNIETITTNTIPELENDLGLLESYITIVDSRLKEVSAEINALAQNNVEQKEKKRNKLNFLKAVTTVAKVVPVYQPALGVAASALEAFALLDEKTSVVEKFKYVSTSYKSIKENQELIKGNIRAAKQFSKNINGNVSLEQIYENKGKIFAQLEPVINKVDEILKNVKYSTVPDNELANEIERLKSENPEYINLIDSIDGMAQKNKQILDKILAFSDQISKISNSISNNANAIFLIKSELSSEKRVSQKTIDCIEKVKRDAIEDIYYYQYVFAKSYEYFTLKQYQGFEQTAPLFSIISYFENKTNYNEILQSIKAIFNTEINKVSETFIEDLTHSYFEIPNIQYQTINLKPEDIIKLNSNKSLKINFFRNAEYNFIKDKMAEYDDILIKNISISPTFVEETVRDFGSGLYGSTQISVSHSGISHRYANGRNFIFYHINNQSETSHIWSTNYVFKTKKEYPNKIEKTYLDLLCEFIKKNESECNNRNADVSFDSELQFSKEDASSSSNKSKLTGLTLTFELSARRRNQSESNIVFTVFPGTDNPNTIFKLVHGSKYFNFRGFYSTTIKRNESLTLLMETVDSKKSFAYWKTNLGDFTANPLTIKSTAPLYAVPVFK